MIAASTRSRIAEDRFIVGTGRTGQTAIRVILILQTGDISPKINQALTQKIDMTEATQAALAAIEIYAARHPRPTQVTIGQAAEMLGLSRWTVAKLVDMGTLALNRCGRIPIEMVDAARAALPTTGKR
ncbi:hypothetical protein AB4Y36_10120 [Paraburkholderia sp. BR10936]|uniref:hypothetical protein n=1 Tax=Paraburkholderia sp. BR10936 TaxID=3236993 RepID=UPI0034D15B1F